MTPLPYIAIRLLSEVVGSENRYPRFLFIAMLFLNESIFFKLEN